MIKICACLLFLDLNTFVDRIKVKFLNGVVASVYCEEVFKSSVSMENEWVGLIIGLSL